VLLLLGGAVHFFYLFIYLFISFFLSFSGGVPFGVSSSQPTGYQEPQMGNPKTYEQFRVPVIYFTHPDRPKKIAEFNGTITLQFRAKTGWGEISPEN